MNNTNKNVKANPCSAAKKKDGVNSNEKMEEPTEFVQRKFRNLKLNDKDDKLKQESSSHVFSGENNSQSKMNNSKLNCEKRNIVVNSTHTAYNSDTKRIAASMQIPSHTNSQINNVRVNPCKFWPKLPPSATSICEKVVQDSNCIDHDNDSMEHVKRECNKKSADVFKNFSSCSRKSKASRCRLQSWPKLPSSDIRNNNDRTISESHATLSNGSNSASELQAGMGEGTASSSPGVDRELIKEQRKLKKEYQKLERKKKQEERQRKYEEDVRRERIAPKCQSVRMIDSSMKERFSGRSQETKISYCSPNQLTSDFPTLSSSFYKNRDAYKNESVSAAHVSPAENEHPTGDRQFQEDINEACLDKKSENEAKSLGDLMKRSKAHLKPDPIPLKNETENEQKSSRKKPKIKDPIMLNIFEAIKVLENKKRKPSCVSKMLNMARKRKHLVSDAGNFLDSDRPLRKRGKVRMNKKKKITPIKLAILRERRIKAESKNQAKLELEQTRKILLNNDYKFSNDIMLFKLNRLPIPDYGNDSRSNNSGTNSLLNNKHIDFSNTTCENAPEVNFCSENESLCNICTTDSQNSSLEYNNIDVILKDKLSEVLENATAKVETQQLEVEPKKLIHSRKFKVYCDQWPIKELVESVNEILHTLSHFQERMHERDPIKAAAKRRFNIGMREVIKYLGFGKVKLLIIATDIEEVTGEGGLFEVITKMREMAEMQSVPYVYANSRWGLKKIMKKKSPISCIAIRNYEGAEVPFRKILQLLPEAQKLYREKLSEAELKCGRPKEIAGDPNSIIIRSMLEKLGSTIHKTIEPDESVEDNDSNCPFLLALMK